MCSVAGGCAEIGQAQVAKQSSVSTSYCDNRENVMKISRSQILITAFVTAFGLALMHQPSHAAVGQTALGKCVDSVVAACNKRKTDAGVNACKKSGVSQCEKQHRRR